MTDPRVDAILQHRAERGAPRGAEAVWNDAATVDYVAPPPAHSPRRPVLFVAASLIVVAAVAGIALRDDGSSVAPLDGGDPNAPATCLLRLQPGSRQSPFEWTEDVSGIDGVTQARPVWIEGGRGVILGSGGQIDLEPGTRGTSFNVRPVSAVSHLADDADVEELTCLVAPEGSYIPEPLPEGTEVLIVFLDPYGGPSVRDAYPELLELLQRDDVHAAEAVDRDAAWEEFHRLFADEPDMLAAVTPEILPESVRLLVDSSSVAALRTELEGRVGVYRVVAAAERERQ